MIYQHDNDDDDHGDNDNKAANQKTVDPKLG